MTAAAIPQPQDRQPRVPCRTAILNLINAGDNNGYTISELMTLTRGTYYLGTIRLALSGLHEEGRIEKFARGDLIRPRYRKKVRAEVVAE